MKLKSKTHLKQTLQHIIERGGEGIMLRYFNSPYKHGRSNYLLKLKASQGDKEGIVVGVLEDKSVLIKLPDGTTFTVPSANIHLPSPLCTGDIITFNYEMNSRRDKPLNPQIVRLRKDVTWDDVIRSSRQETDFLKDSRNFILQSMRYWTMSNMRLFMEKFAKKRGLNPLSPSTWYNCSSEFLRTKGGKLIANKFKGGYFVAVKRLFPELKLDGSFQRRLWKEIPNRRNYFESIAKSNGFDPGKADHWYEYFPKINQSDKVLQGIIAYHNFSVSQSLIDLFPDIGLDVSHLQRSSGEEARRQFFIDYANMKGFNYKDGKEWYKNWNQIWGIKGARRVASYHDFNISKALLDLFPNIGLDPSKLTQPWIEERKRKEFLEEFAKREGFDAKNSEDWYSHLSLLRKIKGMSGLGFHHKNSASQALIDLFPNIGLNRSKMIYYSSLSLEDKKSIFLNYAKEHGFDPAIPENWYSHIDNIKLMQKTQGKVSYSNNGVSEALREVFPTMIWDKKKINGWKDASARRQFFVQFANRMNFNYSLPLHWYTFIDKIKSKNLREILSYHSNSLPMALVDLFPNIGLSLETLQKQAYWSIVDNQKKAFIDLADSKNFDYTNPDDWYYYWSTLNTNDVEKILSYYGNDMGTALMVLFPNIGLDKSKMSKKVKWNLDNRRRFFIEYAKVNKFDPLIPDNWYPHYTKLWGVEGVRGVVYHHQNSISQALLDLFPNIGLVKQLFAMK